MCALHVVAVLVDRGLVFIEARAARRLAYQGLTLVVLHEMRDVRCGARSLGERLEVWPPNGQHRGGLKPQLHLRKFCVCVYVVCSHCSKAQYLRSLSCRPHSNIADRFAETNASGRGAKAR